MAKPIFEKQVEPIFKLTNLNYEVILTERANHAYDVIQELSEDSWKTIDGIISVGGDGLFNEIMCSGIIRTQNEAGIDITDLNIDNLVTPHVRFGIIPAGNIPGNKRYTRIHMVQALQTQLFGQFTVSMIRQPQLFKLLSGRGPQLTVALSTRRTPLFE